jgi:hypothetical protein
MVKAVVSRKGAGRENRKKQRLFLSMIFVRNGHGKLKIINQIG